MIEAILRILASKKAICLKVPTLANAVASSRSIRPRPSSSPWTPPFEALFLAQWFLDLRWGSKSDGSGPIAGLLLLYGLNRHLCSSRSRLGADLPSGVSG